jgi:hypothetical protein
MTDLNALLPNPKDINLSAAHVDFKHLDKTALRRAKVRELMQMGYNNTQISLILEKGIRVGEGNEQKEVQVPCSEGTIRNDINYIQTEFLSADDDMLVKRGELLDKLGFLYNQAVSNYTTAKGAVKNSFLNTALNVINKIMEVEGVKSPENLNVNLNAEAKVAQFAAEIHKLSENDKSTILSAIRKVREGRFNKGNGESGVSDSEPEVRASTSNDEGVPGES